MTMTNQIKCPCCQSDNTAADGLADHLTFAYCLDCYAEWDEAARQPPALTPEAVWEWFCERLQLTGREIFISRSGKLKGDEPYSQHYRTILTAEDMESLGWANMPPASRSDK